MHSHPVFSGTPDISTQLVSSAPRIVLALEGIPNAVELKRLLQAHGFDVHSARSFAEARSLARQGQTVASVIATEANKLESGWLTCKKMLLEQPAMRVVLVGNKPSAKSERFAHFLGASAYVSTSSSVQSIARAALGGELPSIN
jgi:ActR/RegA family two-component response regulator